LDAGIYTQRNLGSPLTTAPITFESQYSAETSVHYFFSGQTHTRLTHVANSSYYDGATLFSSVPGYDRVDLMLYYEPGISKRFFLQPGNIFGDDIPDMRSGATDDMTIRVGSDFWF